MLASESVVAEVVSFLEEDGIVLHRTGSPSEFAVGSESERKFWHRPVLTIPGDLLAEYLVDVSRQYADSADPGREALSVTGIHLMEHLGTDHGSGANATTALGFRRNGSGRVELFVEKELPKVERPEGADGDVFEWTPDRP